MRTRAEVKAFVSDSHVGIYDTLATIDGHQDPSASTIKICVEKHDDVNQPGVILHGVCLTFNKHELLNAIQLAVHS